MMLADTIRRFADAVEALIKDELAYPFSTIPSAALSDRAVDSEHVGTRTKKIFTRLAANQVYDVAVQLDLHRGMAAVLPAMGVFFAPYPLGRTCVATAAKAWFILDGATREERLQRYLNEELGALYGAPWDFSDEASRDDIAALADDLVAVGVTAGLRAVRPAKAKDWQAPHLVSPRQCDGGRPASETQVVLKMFAASGLGADQVSKPYALLSAATHGRFKQSGVSESLLTGRTEYGVPTMAVHSSAGTIAKVTVLAAIATRTHLRSLARYANVPEAVVHDCLGDPLAQWCEMGGVPVPE
jgi:protein-disulfide isomerase-like protein with CxxC motif